MGFVLSRVPPPPPIMFLARHLQLFFYNIIGAVKMIIIIITLLFSVWNHLTSKMFKHTNWEIWSSNQVQLGKFVGDVEVLLVEWHRVHGHLPTINIHSCMFTLLVSFVFFVCITVPLWIFPWETWVDFSLWRKLDQFQLLLKWCYEKQQLATCLFSFGIFKWFNPYQT